LLSYLHFLISIFELSARKTKSDCWKCYWKVKIQNQHKSNELIFKILKNNCIQGVHCGCLFF
jgi:hypothetical protein